MEAAPGQRDGVEPRVALWHAPGVEPPPLLLNALAARKIAAVPVQSSFRALAELCRGGAALVIVHPETMADAAAVWEARARYAPGARLWMYGPASNPKLRAIVEEDVAGWLTVVVTPRPEAAPPRPAAPQPRPAAPPRLKLAGDGEVPPEAAPVEDGDGAAKESRAGLLSAEELRMLLGDDEPDAASGR